IKSFGNWFCPSIYKKSAHTWANNLDNSFLNHFAIGKDPRIRRIKSHLLIDIIAIVILAIIY
ncbi:MAG: hypothetical protein AAF298_09615, partial [Cyanobacteria bacterium P01_A01_bin.40]